MREDSGGNGNEKIDWGMFVRLATGLGDEWDLGSEHKRGTSDDSMDFGSGNPQLGWINLRGNRLEQKNKEFFPTRVVRNACTIHKRVCQAESRTPRLRGQVRSQQQSESRWLRKNPNPREWAGSPWDMVGKAWSSKGMGQIKSLTRNGQ